MIAIHVKQNGNQIRLEGSENINITYEIDGTDIPKISDCSFAVWHILPYAISKGMDIHVDGCVDPQTIENAKNVSLIWEMWQPKKFKTIKITATEVKVPNTAVNKTVLTFFSGGVDSTHMLYKLGINELPKPLLTVHGMDYNLDNLDGFRELLTQTDPLVEYFNYYRIILRTNASKFTKGEHAWGMVLGGHAHIFSGLFSGARFAADVTPAQEFLNFPWGLNSITNKMMSGTHFLVSDMCNNYTRGMKIAELANNDMALRSISFCKKKSFRPKNCGKCKKCIRTKLMFAAATGLTPNIFLEAKLTSEDVKSIDLTDKVERHNFINSFQIAESTRYLKRIPELARRFENEIRTGKESAGINSSNRALKLTRRLISAIRRRLKLLQSLS